MIRTEIITPAGAMSVLRWDRAGPAAAWLHFAHATGMNAALYAALLDPLADRFRILASDARGHGFSRLPADPAAPLSWHDFAADLIGLIDSVDPNSPWLLAGHSMGATVSLLAADARPARCAGLVLTDPAMIPFDLARGLGPGEIPANPMADQAGRRRGNFGSRAEARAAYAGRGVFGRWADADLDAYLDGGLLPAGDGVALACAPGWEAATFRAVATDVEPALARLDRPFVLVAGANGSTVRDADLAAFAAHRRCLDAERLAETSHFVPLERPDAIREAVIRVAAAATAGAHGAL
jgi:pimeloyl-ACP methyl ester carboxylesterase